MDRERIERYAADSRYIGGMADAHGYGHCEEPDCGDVLQVAFRCEREVVTDLRYEITESACLPAKASAAALAELALGKAVMEAYLIGAGDIAAHLGGLNKENMHCAMMAELAMKRACADYSRRRGERK